MNAPSRMGRPMGADGAATRKRIMAAAMSHVARVGYGNATMKAIAEEAELTSAAIYYYFRSKQELVVAVLTSVVGEVMHRLEDAALAERTLPGQFIALFEEALVCTQDYPAVTRFEASVAMEVTRHPEFGDVLGRRRVEEERLYRSLVDRAVQRGELAGDVDRQAVVDMFTSLTWGLTYLSTTAPVERHRAAIRVVEGLLAGVPFTTPTLS